MSGQHVIIHAWMNYSELGKYTCPLKERMRHFFVSVILHPLSALEQMMNAQNRV